MERSCPTFQLPISKVKHPSGLNQEHIPVALNRNRQLWDPKGDYADCLFRRQPQTFPDVLFRRETGSGSETLLGIEVKSWYVLAREAEPSFRFNVNREFCHHADLCAVYPWAFSSGVAGTPRLFRPLVIGARKAARLREESWIAKAQDEDWKVIHKPVGAPRFHPTQKIVSTTPAHATKETTWGASRALEYGKSRSNGSWRMSASAAYRLPLGKRF